MQNIRGALVYATCLGFGAGVLWRSFWNFDSTAAALLGAGGACLIFFFSISASAPRTNWGLLCSVFALACSLGILRSNAADRPPPEIFARQAGRTISFSGAIIAEPEEKADSALITIAAEKGSAKTNIRISVKGNGTYQYGDTLFVAGRLEQPADFLTLQAKTFDYADYLKKDRIFFVMQNPRITILSRGNGNPLARMLYALRGKIDAALDHAMPEPESALARAITLGERAAFSDALRQALTATGLIHIAIISGYHVTLVARWIMSLLGFLPIRYAGMGGILGIAAYVVMTGGAITSIRAGIMASLAVFARLTGRTYDALRALIAAGAIMTLINPRLLVFDVSFQLSFLATIAILCFTPYIEKHLALIPWKKLREIAAYTIAAYVFLLPFVLYKIGNWSLVALPANLLVTPLIPLTMILSLLTGFAGLASGALAWLIGKIAYALVLYELFVIGMFSKFRFAALSVPDFPLWLTIVIYGIFFFYLLAPGRRTRIPLAAFALTIAAAGFFAYRHYESQETANRNMRMLLGSMADVSSETGLNPPQPFAPGARTKSAGCDIRGSLADSGCTPGAVFENAAPEHICVRGYTERVRNVSAKLRKEIYAAYGVSYPQPRGAYEVDHLIPLALGGSNDIANLWTEAAEPVPGFHEKDIVEIYLQQEVCGGRVALPIAQKQIADDWLAVYTNLTPEQIAQLKKKYGRN